MMLIPLALLFCAAVHITNSTRQLSGCLNNPADIVFAVDSSDYVSDLEFEKVKVFLMGLIRLLKLDDNQIRVGVVQYDNSVTKTVSLTGKKVDLSRDILQLKKSPGIPRAYLGLRSLRGQFSTGGRPNVPHIGIVLTGGLGEYAQMAYSQAKLLRDSGIRMLMVGFGSRVTTDEIDDVAWNPQLAITSPHAEDLTKNMKMFLNKLCNCMSSTSTSQASSASGGASAAAVAKIGLGGMRAPIIGDLEPVSNHLPMQNGKMIPDGPIPLPEFAAHASSSAGISVQTGVQETLLPDRGMLRSPRLGNSYSSSSAQSQPDVQLPQSPRVPFSNVPDLPKSPSSPLFPQAPSIPEMQPSLPSLPSLPILPSVPELPDLPRLPELPSLPSASSQKLSEVLKISNTPDVPKLDISDFTVPKLPSIEIMPGSPLKQIADVDISDFKLKLPKLADIADRLKPDLPDLSSLVASLKDSHELAKLSKLANEAAKMKLPDGLGDVIKALKEAVADIKGKDSTSRKDDSSSSSSDDDDDLPEGICNQCIGKTVKCRVRLPNACDKYVICSGDDDSDSSSDDSNDENDKNDDDSSDEDDNSHPRLRTCPLGEFWDDDEDVCKHSADVDCPFDSCKNMLGSPSRKSSASCRAYWRCEYGRSVSDCCPVGTAFKENDGCVKDESCTGSCSDDEPDSPFCDKKPVSGTSSFYRQYTPAKVWVRMPCAPGTFFIEGSCGCNRQSSGIPQGAGRKPMKKEDSDKRIDRDYQNKPNREVYICFDSDTADTSGKYTYVENENSLVSVYDGVAHFQGDGKLTMPRFSGAPYGNNWIFKLKYKLNDDDSESSDDSGSRNDNSSSSDSSDRNSAESTSSEDDSKKDNDDDLVTLFSNGDCSKHRCQSKPSLVLATSDDETILEVTDSTQKVHRLRVSKLREDSSDSSSDSDDNGDSDSSDSKDKTSPNDSSSSDSNDNADSDSNDNKDKDSNKDSSSSDSDDNGDSDSSDSKDKSGNLDGGNSDSDDDDSDSSNESAKNDKNDGWRTVVVSLRKDKLRLKDGNKEVEESFQDSTPLVSYSSLQIGGGSIYNPFKGLMDEIELFLDDN